MIKMNWKYILKQPEEYPRDEINRIMEEKGLTEEEAKKVYRGRPEYARQLGDPKPEGGYAFSVSMFYDQNWIKRMRAILETPGTQGRIVDAAVEDAAQAALDTLNTLLEKTGYESEVRETEERYKESTRLEEGEKPLMEPEEGGAGRGMIPKRTEYYLGTVGRLFGTIMEDLMISIQEQWDREQFDEDDEREIIDTLEDERIDPGEVKEWFPTCHKPVIETLKKKLIQTIAEIEKGGEGDEKQQARNVNQITNEVTKEVIENETFQSWVVHIFAILSFKIIKGMAQMSEEVGEQWLGDVMTDEEKEWFKRYSETREMELGPGIKIEGTKPPPLDPKYDPSLGIPKGKLFNPDVDEMTEAQFQEWQKKIEEENKAFLKAWRIIKSNRCCRPRRGILDGFY